jgi:uncharacterized protein
VVAAAGALGAARLRIAHDPLVWFPAEAPVREAFTELDRAIGGATSLALLVEAPPGRSLRDREFLLALEALERHIAAYRDPRSGEAIVSNTTSVLDVVRETHRAVQGGAPEEYRIPDTQRGVSDLLTLFENAGKDELRRLATLDLEHGLMLTRVRWLDAGGYAPLVAHVQAGIDEVIGDAARVRPAGSLYGFYSILDALVSGLARSFAVALLVIALVMLLLLRDLKLGAIAVVPNLLPILAVLGFMGFADIPLDLGNLLLASIAVGVVVDDTIHFLVQFQRGFREHGDVEAAIERAFGHTGRALLSTSAILVAGFASHAVATMHHVQRFGLLIGMSVVLALFIDLVFLPALLRRFYGGCSKCPPLVAS